MHSSSESAVQWYLLMISIDLRLVNQDSLLLPLKEVDV